MILNPGVHSNPLENLIISGGEGISCLVADSQCGSFVLFNDPQCLAGAFPWEQDYHCNGQDHSTLLHHSKGCLSSYLTFNVGILFFTMGGSKIDGKRPEFKTRPATYRSLGFPGSRVH